MNHSQVFDMKALKCMVIDLNLYRNKDTCNLCKDLDPKIIIKRKGQASLYGSNSLISYNVPTKYKKIIQSLTFTINIQLVWDLFF